MRRSNLLVGLLVLAGVLASAERAAAFYHPSLGRFTSRDPIAEPRGARFIPRDEPDGYVDGMSLYEYVHSRPTDLRDLEGRFVSWGKATKGGEPGTDEDVKKAKAAWEALKKRKCPPPNENKQPYCAKIIPLLEKDLAHTLRICVLHRGASACIPDDQKAASQPGKGSDATMWIDPNATWFGKPGSPGAMQYDPEDNLCHEGVHAYHYFTGTLPRDPWDDIAAAVAGNEIREIKGLPVEVHSWRPCADG